MESLLLDESGDLVIKNGDLQIVNGLDEVKQLLRTLLQSNKNEWFLDPEMGLDYTVINGVKHIDEESLLIAFNDVADQIDEIDRIADLEIEFNRQTRRSHIKAVAYLIGGDEFEFEEVF